MGYSIDIGNLIPCLYKNSLNKKPKDFLPWVFYNLNKHISFDKVFFATLDKNKNFLPNFPHFGEDFTYTNTSKFFKITIKNANSNTYQQILLFNNTEFSNQDKLILNLIFPSIVASFTNCIWKDALTYDTNHTVEYALIDRKNNSCYASNNFTKSMRKHLVNDNSLTSNRSLSGGRGVIASLDLGNTILNIKPHSFYLGVFIAIIYPKTQFDKLTNRQQQVVKLLLDNKTYKEIAQCLEITPNTVVKHINAIYPKLGIQKSYEIKKFKDVINFYP
jgi:DNA-binding CsgD family transcriptional regulator